MALATAQGEQRSQTVEDACPATGVVYEMCSKLLEMASKKPQVTNAKVLGIATRAKPGAEMRTTDAARIGERGLEGERRLGVRQVTLLAREGWEAACKQLGTTLPWTTRRANVLVEGVPLASSVGRWLRVGEAVLEVVEEAQPCELMEKLRPGLRAALVKEWRGGVCCKVVIAGDLKVGDAVKFET